MVRELPWESSWLSSFCPGEAILAAADEVAPVTEVTDEVAAAEVDEVAVVDGLPLFLALAFDGGASAPADSDAPFALAASFNANHNLPDWLLTMAGLTFLEWKWKNWNGTCQSS